MKTQRMVTAAVLTMALALGACSSSKDATTDGDTTETPAESTPQVSIDPSVGDKLDIESGSAVIPGSIESVEQDLSSACAEAVAPLRELMKKYPSLRQVPPGDYDEPFAQAKKCEEIDAQEWADFYTLELAGWLYAKTDD